MILKRLKNFCTVVILMSSILHGNGQDCFEEEGLDINVEFSFESIQNANVGQNICVSLFVNGYDEILFATFGITWDPTILSYTNSVAIPSDPSFSNFSLNEGQTGIGNLGVILDTTDPNSGAGTTYSDGFEYFVICFDVIGNPGGCTQTIFTNNINSLGEPSLIYTPQSDLSITCEANVTAVAPIDNANICIACNSLYIDASSCPSQSGINNGVISFSICGDMAPYSYSLNGVPTGSNIMESQEVVINNLAPGTYTIDVIDSSTPINTESVIITVGTGTSISADPLVVSNPDCFSDPDDGAIQITGLTGGTAPYQFEWSNFEFGTDNIDDLAPGDYTVTITDAGGCQYTDMGTVVADSIIVTAILVQGASCPGVNDAIVTLSATGGAPFGSNMYEFNNNPATDILTVTGIMGGIPFAYRAEDANGCETEVLFIDIPIASAPIADIVTSNISCSGAMDGVVSIMLNGSSSNIFNPRIIQPNGDLLSGGGIGGDPYAYNNTGLAPGTYQVILTERVPDPNNPSMNMDGCIVDTSFTILEPLSLSISLDMATTSNPSCIGGDGKIAVQVMGGTAPYTYTWSNGGNNDNNICDLSPATYSVTVTDVNDCEIMLSHTLIDSDNMLDIDAAVSNPISCTGAQDGILEVIVNSGGTFSYQWARQDGNILGTAAILNNVGPDEYFVTVTDINNFCSSVDSIEIFDATPIDISAILTAPTCDSIANGIISIVENSGATPFTYLWDDSNNTTSALLASQTAGTYNLTVTDANMCTIDTMFTLQGPPAVLQNITAITPTLCPGESNASITIETSGGNGSTMFNYVLTDLITGAILYNQVSNSPHTISGLTAGQFILTTSDLTCPSTPDTITIEDAIQMDLIVDMANIVRPSCFGDCDGSASVRATGGAGGYSFTWTVDGSTGNMNTTLCASMQYISIVDANNCTHLDSFMITQPDSLIAVINPFLTSDISCASANTGMIAIDASGGNETGYIYNWDPDVSSNNLASNLGIGTYSVTVTDNLGCSDVASYTLSTPPAVSATIPTPPLPACFGGSTCISVTNVMGGIGAPYTYSINNGLNIPIDSCVQVISGNYNIQVFDASACAFDTMIFVDQPMEIIAAIGPDEITIPLGDSTVSASIQISSELAIDNIVWSPDANFECQDPLCETITLFPTTSTTYTATVFDINGCSASDNVDVILDDTRLVYVPNTFSPNNDGVNDNFVVYSGQGVNRIQIFRVYDRWGNLIHEEQGDEGTGAQSLLGWDGRFRGQDLDPGVFTYHVQASFIDNRVIDFTGTITLTR